MDEDVLIDFAKRQINVHRNDKNILRYLFYKGYLRKNYPQDNIQLKLQDVLEKLDDMKKEFDNKVRLNGLGIVTDEELIEYNKTYRIQKTELENDKLKYTNINKQVEEEKLKFEEFLKYLDNIDVNNLKNSDLKKVFSKIVVFSDYKFDYYNGEQGKVVEDALEKYANEPYTFKQKDYIKKITCNYMFMNVQEWDLFDFISGSELLLNDSSFFDEDAFLDGVYKKKEDNKGEDLPI